MKEAINKPLKGNKKKPIKCTCVGVTCRDISCIHNQDMSPTHWPLGYRANFRDLEDSCQKLKLPQTLTAFSISLRYVWASGELCPPFGLGVTKQYAMPVTSSVSWDLFLPGVSTADHGFPCCGSPALVTWAFGYSEMNFLPLHHKGKES